VKPILMTVAALLALAFLADAALAGPGRRGHARRFSPEARQKILDEFDANKDGKLDEGERAAAKSALKQRFEAKKKEILDRFDTDKDGKLSPDERKAAREAHQKAMITAWFAKADTNGDGQLSVDEIEAARQARRTRFQKALDKNGDGTIDPAERMRLRRGMHARRGQMRRFRHRQGDEATPVTPGD
jgi:Ca2+-binding EF-hand superfamily protein